jgi:hypothetical protein
MVEFGTVFERQHSSHSATGTETARLVDLLMQGKSNRFATKGAYLSGYRYR